MRFEHSFSAAAPRNVVAAFHSRASSMAKITPPPIITQIHRAPARLREGDEMEFTLWIGPLPLRWLARIEQVSEGGFTDRQLRGPFQAWIHRHEFEHVQEHCTRIHDKIEIQIRKHWFWGIVGLGMYLGLPALFAFRTWKTRRLLCNWDDQGSSFVIGEG